MALVLADRVQEYSTTTGTGTLTLSGAYAGFQTFAAGIGNGNTCYYTITSDTNQWEVGIGTVGVGTLARTTLISSSTGSLVSFVGTLTVFVTYPAEKAVYSDNTTLVAPAGALLPITSGGTGASTAAAARTALGLGTIATQNANSVAVTGGAIDGTTVGATTVAAGSFTTLNSSGNTQLGGLSGNQSLQVNNVATAVNYAQIVGAATGAAPTISAQGSDANIELVVTGKGTGSVFLNGTTTSRTVQIDPVAGGTTAYTQFARNAAINEQQIVAANTANLGLVATGGGSINFRTTSILQAAVSYTASAVNYVNLTGAATGAAPTIFAQGSDANISLVLTGKGTGSVFLNGTTTSRTVQIDPVASGTTVYTQFTRNAAINEQQISATGDANFGLLATGGGAINFRTGGGGILQAVVSYTASAVNYLNLTGAATNAAPTISAQGSDANIGLVLTGKGTGVVALGGTTAANSGVQVSPVASAVNYWTLQGATTGNGLSLAANGTDANIGMGYNSKGGSGHLFNTHGSTLQFYISPTGAAVNRIEVTGGTTGNPPQVIASGSDTNINLKLTPQGTGKVQFGTYTATVLSPTGFITITDAAGTSRRLLVG